MTLESCACGLKASTSLSHWCCIYSNCQCQYKPSSFNHISKTLFSLTLNYLFWSKLLELVKIIQRISLPIKVRCDSPGTRPYVGKDSQWSDWERTTGSLFLQVLQVQCCLSQHRRIEIHWNKWNSCHLWITCYGVHTLAICRTLAVWYMYV